MPSILAEKVVRRLQFELYKFLNYTTALMKLDFSKGIREICPSSVSPFYGKDA